MIDATALATGIAATLVTDQALPQMQEMLQGHEKTTEEHLRDIHNLLIHLTTFLKEQPVIKGDHLKVVQLFKDGQGSNYPLKRGKGYLHLLLFTPVSSILNFNIPGLGAFTYTIPATTWTNIDFPENTNCIVDPTDTVASRNVLIRETNSNIYGK